MMIGIDLDHTISAIPEFFSVMTSALVTAGHEVHVITYREVGTEEDVREELRDFGIHYTALHLPPVPGLAPSAWKCALAKELGIEVMIEDSPEVLSRMPPKVQRLWLCDPEVFDLDVCIRALREEIHKKK
jgi:hypothetical protein